MSDFTSAFWPFFIAAVTLLSIVACALLLVSMSKGRVSTDPEKTGHVWDEDLVELNNPLPRWWIALFWVTIAFGLAYLAWYPGLGAFKGAGGWTSVAEYEDEMRYAERLYGPIYQRFAATDIKALAADPQARAAGEKLFLNYCTQCHASDARGNKGFPNLTDNDWLYGGAPKDIVQSITFGREGTMPPIGAALGEQGVDEVIDYVLSLSGHTEPADKVAAGKARFAVCAGCHGDDGKGNLEVGAPNLTTKIWLYGSDIKNLTTTVTYARNSTMPAWGHRLDPVTIKALTLYVHSLGGGT